MLNDLIRGFGQKLPETIRPEICFRLVVFLDASRLADADLEKTTVELLAPSDSLDRFRTLVLSTGILNFVFSTLVSEAEMKLLKILQRKAPTAQKGISSAERFSVGSQRVDSAAAGPISCRQYCGSAKNLLAES